MRIPGHKSAVLHDMDLRIKRSLGKSYDYRQNPKNIVVPAADFYAVLSRALRGMRASPAADTTYIESQLSTLKKDATQKMLITAPASGAVTTLVAVTPFPVQQIVDIVKAFARQGANVFKSLGETFL
jgi:cell division GTPase FtsZ